MAKGQIHMGKNGPEKCGVDTSKEKSRGCPYESTGHYSTAEEAIEVYAKLNRVEPEELKALVADGATPLDAVGLIRSGYGVDFLSAERKDPGKPAEPTLEEDSARYLEARAQISIDLREVAPGTRVEGVQSGRGKIGIVIRKNADDGRADFSYVVVKGTDGLRFEQLAVGEFREEATAVGKELSAALDRNENPKLRTELERMLDSYERMRAGEAVQES